MLDYSENYWKEIQKTASLLEKTEALKDKKILITGATGMICSTVTDVLWFLKKHNNISLSVSLVGRDEKKDGFKIPIH